MREDQGERELRENGEEEDMTEMKKKGWGCSSDCRGLA